MLLLLLLLLLLLRLLLPPPPLCLALEQRLRGCLLLSSVRLLPLHRSRRLLRLCRGRLDKKVECRRRRRAAARRRLLPHGRSLGCHSGDPPQLCRHRVLLFLPSSFLVEGCRFSIFLLFLLLLLLLFFLALLAAAADAAAATAATAIIISQLLLPLLLPRRLEAPVTTAASRVRRVRLVHVVLVAVSIASAAVPGGSFIVGILLVQRLPAARDGP